MPDIKVVCDFLKPLLTNYADVRPAKALDADPLDANTTLPILLAHPVEEAAYPNSTDFITRQRVDEHFALLTICKIEDLEARRQEVFDAVLGQQLPGYDEVMFFVGGTVQNITASVIWWRDIYKTATNRRQKP